MTEPERELAERLGIDEQSGLKPRAPYLSVALGALVGAGFALLDDKEGCWHLFVWIAIHDYDSFGALNETVGVASGRLFTWLDELELEDVLVPQGPEGFWDWSYTERGRLAAYLVRETLEDFVADPDSVL